MKRVMPMMFIRFKTKTKLYSKTKWMKSVVYIRALNGSRKRKRWNSLVSLSWALLM